MESSRLKGAGAVVTGLFLTGAGPAPSDLYTFQLQELTDGIYVASRPEPLRLFVEGNVTIVVNTADVVVVDAGGSTESARNVIALIRKLTPKPVRYLIDTHDHVDHTLGNEEFSRSYPGIEIVSSPATRADLLTEGVPYVADIARSIEPQLKRGREIMAEIRSGRAPGYEQVIAFAERYSSQDIYTRQAAYRTAAIVPPTATYEGRLVLHRGERTIQILSLGHGDTAGDTVVYLPRERVVCTGDMLTEPVPFGYSTRPLEWAKTLQKLDALDAAFIVPGHGAVQRDKAYLRRVMGLLQSVQAQVRAAIAEGLDLEGVRKRVDLGPMAEAFAGGDPVRRNRFEAWFVKPAVEQAFEALKAEAAPKP
jgi:glyoxylase-like metal-dependent hydrolase (beta-lactamase superfamily II)